MARRTVTATFSAGMISDEPKPGFARHLENMVPRPDGVIPVNGGRQWVANATALSTSNGITTASIPRGWSGGGTVHPAIGFIGLLDIIKTTATATNSEAVVYASGFGLAGSPHASATRSLMLINDVGSATGIGTMRFADHGGLTPVVQDNIATATGTASFVPSIVGQKLRGHQWFVNTENEVLIIGKESTTADEWVYRYAGATGNTGLTTGITNGSMSAAGSATGWAFPTASAAWTNVVTVSGDCATAASASGMYLGLIIGQGLLSSVTSTGAHSVHTMMITAVGAVTGTGSTASRNVYLDRRVYVSLGTRYSRCVIGNTAQLTPSQITRSAATQPFSGPELDSGFTSGRHNPSGRNGACYHQGRLFLANGSKLSWSGTVDETLQLTANGTFASGTSSTSVTTATTADWGIEFTHLSLYSASGYLNVFPQIGGDIVGLVSFNDELLILKRGGLFRMVGSVSYDGASNALDLQCISNSAGPEGHFSWAETPQGIIFTWNDGIWMYDGNELQEISRGTISQSYLENLRQHRMNNSGAVAETVPTRVVSDGKFVYFTPMRYTLSTASGDETAMSTSMHNGYSIHHRHMVLDLGSQKWFYIGGQGLSLPSDVLQIRSTRGSKYSTYWLGTIPLVTTGNSILLTDMHNVLHEHGPARVANTSDATWSDQPLSLDESYAISHPLLGFGNFESVRPTAALIKHTAALSGTASEYPAGTEYKKVTLIDAEHSLSPATYASVAAMSGTAVGMPEWWADMNSVLSASSVSMETADAWAPRQKWSVDGSTSTARAMSVVDRMLLEGSENAMTSPSILYRDDGLWKEWSQTTRATESHILHAVAIEFEEVGNRTDR